MHLSLPQKMTPENLAQWITENSIEQRTHDDKFELTRDEIQNLEHSSSVASRAIDRLEQLKETFNNALKDGNGIVDEAGEVIEGSTGPVSFTIPPTKGLKILKANREFADSQIESGVRLEPTELYGIPYPETEKIVFVDIEGNHFDQYDYNMNPDQIEKYARPLLTAAAGSEEKKAKKEKVVTLKKVEEFRPSADLPFAG